MKSFSGNKVVVVVVVFSLEQNVAKTHLRAKNVCKMINANLLGCVSLGKSKSGFLYPKTDFAFLYLYPKMD